jgi:tight adherence protein C
MLIIVFTVLLFATVGFAAYAIWSQLVTERDPVTLRMRSLRALHAGPTAIGYGDRPSLILRLIARLGGFMPARDGKNALRTGLICAGFRRADAPLVFMGAKIACAALFPILYFSSAYLSARPMGHAFFWLIATSITGFYTPSMLLGFMKRQRQDAITRSLPDALDLMVVCVEAGLGIAAALQRVAGEIKLACPPLSQELALVHQEMQTGIPRQDALRNLAQRTGVDDVYALVAMLIQTDKLGTSVAQALRAHSESMRTRRRQRAEKLARKASIKLAFPLVFLVLPALLVIILGPAAIQLVKALVAE